MVMTEQVIVRNFWEPTPEGYTVVNVTSRSKDDWSRALSPFLIGPVLINGCTARNVENAWQYSKVYPVHLDEEGNIKDEYYQWREVGYEATGANRYPFGKKQVPVFSLVDGKRYAYLEAKEKVYIPLYSNAVREIESFKILEQLVSEGMKLCLLDFDAYDHTGKTKKEIIDHPTRKFGHGFCLKWLLDDVIGKEKTNDNQ